MQGVLLDSLSVWWPEVILSLGGLLALLAGAWPGRGREAAHAVAWLALLGSGIALWRTPPPLDTEIFFGVIVCDGFSLMFRWLALGVLAFVCLLMLGSQEVEESITGEYVGLLLFVGVGFMLMAEANHLLMAYVAMELVSLSSYALVGFTKDARSAEASLKYLVFGALASAVMLFGMSLLFGLTGALGFSELQASLAGMSGPLTHAALAAISLLLVGLAFKISLVPFHMWTPDAYEGAPVPVTALLSVGPKAAGLALLIRLTEALQPLWPSLAPLLVGLAIVTMTLGNLAALGQTNVKRLLAYSTIAQVGYLFIGFIVQTPLGTEALVFYLAAYLFMNFGAFATVVAVVNETGSESIDAFRGLAHRAPILAALCAVCLLSLVGIPPLMGFLGKFLLFGSAVSAGYLPLAVVGLLNSAVALYYYVNIIRQMYLLEPSSPTPLATPWPLRLAATICGVMTVFLGVWPGTLLLLIRAGGAANLL